MNRFPPVSSQGAIPPRDVTAPRLEGPTLIWPCPPSCSCPWVPTASSSARFTWPLTLLYLLRDTCPQSGVPCWQKPITHCGHKSLPVTSGSMRERLEPGNLSSHLKVQVHFTHLYLPEGCPHTWDWLSPSPGLRRLAQCQHPAGPRC